MAERPNQNNTSGESGLSSLGEAFRRAAEGHEAPSELIHGIREMAEDLLAQANSLQTGLNLFVEDLTQLESQGQEAEQTQEEHNIIVLDNYRRDVTEPHFVFEPDEPKSGSEVSKEPYEPKVLSPLEIFIQMHPSFIEDVLQREQELIERREAEEEFARRQESARQAEIERQAKIEVQQKEEKRAEAKKPVVSELLGLLRRVETQTEEREIWAELLREQALADAQAERQRLEEETIMAELLREQAQTKRRTSKQKKKERTVMAQLQSEQAQSDRARNQARMEKTGKTSEPEAEPTREANRQIAEAQRAANRARRAAQRENEKEVTPLTGDIKQQYVHIGRDFFNLTFNQDYVRSKLIFQAEIRERWQELAQRFHDPAITAAQKTELVGRISAGLQITPVRIDPAYSEHFGKRNDRGQKLDDVDYLVYIMSGFLGIGQEARLPFFNYVIARIPEGKRHANLPAVQKAIAAWISEQK